MAGLMWVSQHVPPRFEMLELGASAGINTMMERYRYDLGGVTAGQAQSPMQITPEWRGPKPPSVKPVIAAIRGCDLQPIDLRDPASVMRLKSYVWPEAGFRLGRIDAAAKLARERSPDVQQCDAASFVTQAFATPQAEGVTRVLFHSIVWQYIPSDQQRIVEHQLAQTGNEASAEKAFVWLMLETNRETFRHELIARVWNGEMRGEPYILANAHPHGAWVEWLAY
jgi:hypothetical protein